MQSKNGVSDMTAQDFQLVKEFLEDLCEFQKLADELGSDENPAWKRRTAALSKDLFRNYFHPQGTKKRPYKEVMAAFDRLCKQFETTTVKKKELKKKEADVRDLLFQQNKMLAGKADELAGSLQLLAAATLQPQLFQQQPESFVKVEELDSSTAIVPKRKSGFLALFRR